MQIGLGEATPPLKFHACGKCKTKTDENTLRIREYHCPTCNFEMAYPDFAPNGAIRGVLGYLRSPGDVIQDRYRIENVLGKGGFGATYLAEDIKLKGKRRALKEVPDLLFDELEANLLSQLHHPSIPDIVDRCFCDGMIYLILEFGGTRTLEEECRRMGGRVPLPNLLPLMTQLCDVLIYLHAQNPPVVHRDLKPDNILLDDNERIMLVDFGIAKQSTSSISTRVSARAVSHGFSPPEQVLGTGTDERSDIYALGATFYYLLSGQVPPPAHERVAGKELRPVSEIVPDIPAMIDDIVSASLSLNINHRPASVEEFRKAVALSGVSNADGLPSAHRTVRAPWAWETPTGISPPKHIQAVKIGTGEPVPQPVSSTGTADKQEKVKRRSRTMLTACAISLALLCAAGFLYSHNWKKAGPLPTGPEPTVTAQPEVAQTTSGAPPPHGPSSPDGSYPGGSPTASAPPPERPSSDAGLGQFAPGANAATPAGDVKAPPGNAPTSAQPNVAASQPSALDILQQTRRPDLSELPRYYPVNLPPPPPEPKNDVPRKVKHKPKQAVASNESAPSQEQEDNQKFIKRLRPLLTPAPRPSPS
ncbi:MAG TPA: protein kinase, partial [Syntrophobacteraceae bacterium]|nr:protein kinase [Syntrophobacteraceae bacterium]